MAIFTLAGIVGLSVMSVIQDVIGQRITFFISLTITLAGGGFALLAPSFGVWIALRAIQQSQSSIAYNIPFIWAQEFVGPKQRTFVSFLMTLSYSVATVSLDLVAWMCRTWKQIGLITTLPFIFLYSYFFLLDKSPRWLLSAGKTDEATKVLEKMAKRNRKEFELGRIKDQMKLIPKIASQENEKEKKVQG